MFVPPDESLQGLEESLYVCWSHHHTRPKHHSPTTMAIQDVIDADTPMLTPAASTESHVCITGVCKIESQISWIFLTVSSDTGSQCALLDEAPCSEVFPMNSINERRDYWEHGRSRWGGRGGQTPPFFWVGGTSPPVFRSISWRITAL